MCSTFSYRYFEEAFPGDIDNTPATALNFNDSRERAILLFAWLISQSENQ